MTITTMTKLIAKYILLHAVNDSRDAALAEREAKAYYQEMKRRATGKDGWKANVWKGVDKNALKEYKAAQRHAKFLREVCATLETLIWEKPTSARKTSRRVQTH